MTNETSPRVDEQTATYKKKMQMWIWIAFGSVVGLLLILTCWNIYNKATGNRSTPVAEERRQHEPPKPVDRQSQFDQLFSGRRPSRDVQDTNTTPEAPAQGPSVVQKVTDFRKGLVGDGRQQPQQAPEDEESKAMRKWQAQEQIRALKAAQSPWKLESGMGQKGGSGLTRTAAVRAQEPAAIAGGGSSADDPAMRQQLERLQRPFDESASLEERRKAVKERIEEAQKLRQQLAANGAAGLPEAAGRGRMNPAAGAPSRAQLERVNQSFSRPPADVVGYTKDNAYNADIAGKIKVPPGTEIRTTLMKKSISDYTGSSLKAIVSNDVYDVSRRFVLFPKGSEVNIRNIRYKGVNEVLSNRSAFTVREMVLPNGNKIDFTASAADTEGVGAIEGDTNYHFLAQFFGVAAYALVGSKSSYAGTGDGEATYAGDVGEGMRDQVSPLANKYLSVVPTVTLEPGTSFQIVIEKEMYVEPWSDLYAKYVN